MDRGMDGGMDGRPQPRAQQQPLCARGSRLAEGLWQGPGKARESVAAQMPSVAHPSSPLTRRHKCLSRGGVPPRRKWSGDSRPQARWLSECASAARSARHGHPPTDLHTGHANKVSIEHGGLGGAGGGRCPRSRLGDSRRGTAGVAAGRAPGAQQPRRGAGTSGQASGSARNRGWAQPGEEQRRRKRGRGDGASQAPCTNTSTLNFRAQHLPANLACLAHRGKCNDGAGTSSGFYSTLQLLPSRLAHTHCPDTLRSPWHRAANTSVPQVLDKGFLHAHQWFPSSLGFAWCRVRRPTDSESQSPATSPNTRDSSSRKGHPRPKGMGRGTRAGRPALHSPEGARSDPARIPAASRRGVTGPQPVAASPQPTVGTHSLPRARDTRTSRPASPRTRAPADVTRAHGHAPHLHLGARILPRRAPPHRAGWHRATHRWHRAVQHRASHWGHRAGPPGPRKRCRAGPACAGEAALRHRPAPPASASPPPPPSP